VLGLLYSQSPKRKRGTSRDRLAPAEYLIAVDEFAEVELSGLHVLDREELRAVCDHEKTKDAILAALRQGR
jgi:hypothetical protein